MQSWLEETPAYILEQFRGASPILFASILFGIFVSFFLTAYVFFYIVAPRPRPSEPSEKFYTTVSKDGSITDPLPLPCWQDDSIRHAKSRHPDLNASSVELDIDQPTLFISVVVPAYNEQDRIIGMLEEAVNYLEEHYGEHTFPLSPIFSNGLKPKNTPSSNGLATSAASQRSPPRGWEILVVSDGSTDDTLNTVHSFARSHLLPHRPRRISGPWTHSSPVSVNIAPGSVRVVSLARNRGKGGAVAHGLRHVRGKYCIFADADGASKFSDLGDLVSAAESATSSNNHPRAVVVGSRAHLVKSPTVVQRSRLRNFLMYSFHALLSFMTPPRTAAIKDTQCGFKLFTRPSLPHIIPYMHSEGWIFDVEMLMLAESAGIPVVEVPIGWREVKGSKLNVLRDSLGMAWGLAVLRICWGLGIYKRGLIPIPTEREADMKVTSARVDGDGKNHR